LSSVNSQIIKSDIIIKKYPLKGGRMRGYMIILLIFIGGLFLAGSEAEGTDWKRYSHDDLFLFYYDSDNIIRTSKDIVKTWEVRIAKNQKAKDLITQIQKNAGRSIKGYEDIASQEFSYEINCSKKRIRIMSFEDFDDKGSILNSYNVALEWIDIAPKTVFETLSKIACAKPYR
jgi:hypothetical protein